MGFAIGHEKVGVSTIKNFIVKSFMTVTVTVPLVIPMIDTWEIDPNFQVSIFTVANSTRTFPEGIHVT